jgi:hypothetical protein
MSGLWLAIEGLSGQATTEDIENVCAKRCVFIDRPRQRGSDRCGGNADGSAAVDGVRGLRVFGEGRDRFDRGPVTRPISAPGAGTTVVVAAVPLPAAAFAGIVGTGLAIAATQNRRDYYDSYGYYGGAPAYYGGGPAYYGSPGYYASPGYYGGGYYRSGVPHYRGHPLASW